ncbi:MAG: hypothetical protein HYX96_06135 [Chloroflexi bacterium]|nr:hypothetical protein [Chloroflexota bacterium]
MAKNMDYTVDKKEEVVRLGKGGEVETMFRIWATSKGGTYFHLDVPEAELPKADERLTAKAKQLDAI